MNKLEIGSQESEAEIPQSDSLEVLKQERKALEELPCMKELRQKLRKLIFEHEVLDSQYNFNEGGVRKGTIENLPKKDQESIKQKVKEYSEKLDKNEAEQAEIRKEIEKMEDETKTRISSALKK